jgi:hypothetical protein
VPLEIKEAREREFCRYLMTSTAQFDMTFKTTVKVQVSVTLEIYHEGPEGK